MYIYMHMFTYVNDCLITRIRIQKKVYTFQLVDISFKSLLICSIESSNCCLFFLVIYLLKKPGCLSCGFLVWILLIAFP